MLLGTYDLALVCLSVFIAAAASYTALDLAGRAGSATGISRQVWLVTAALAMGAGIWAMHFIGMLAFRLPALDVSYDVRLTALSLALAVLATGLGFTAVSGQSPARKSIVIGGCVMGLGVVGMHYMGMAAMRMAAMVSYSLASLVLAAFIAITASTAALFLATRTASLIGRCLAALSMGLAIAGMHYTGMAGASFVQCAAPAGLTHSSFRQESLALAVAGFTLLILVFAIIAAVFDRKYALLAQHQVDVTRRSEEQFRTLYSSTPANLYALDEAYRIRQVSDACVDLLRLPRDQLLGRSIDEFMEPESAARYCGVGRLELLERGQTTSKEYRMKSAAGQQLDVLISEKLIGSAASHVPVLLGGISDVTRRKRAEEAVHHLQKMESLGQLTGGVAHDFNNLLAVISGSLEVLRRRFAADPRSLLLIDNALKGVERGSTLTHRMLAFARKQDLVPRAVSIPILCAGMHDLLQRSLGPMIDVQMEFAANLPSAKVDPHQLELAILNLCLNARDAMPDGGTVTVKARLDAAGPPSRTSSLVSIAVCDTGSGMDASTLSRATEPFFTTKGVGKGTGLGLSMVRGLAEQSGGHLRLESVPGLGTRAEILLPIAQEDAALHDEDGPRIYTGRRLRILTVDDDPLVLASTAALLQEMGHLVECAADGSSALKQVLETQFDVVIADQAMPGLTGLELSKRAKESEVSARFILVSGYTDQENLGSLVFLKKPFTLDGLAQALNHALEDETVVPFRPRHTC